MAISAPVSPISRSRKSNFLEPKSRTRLFIQEIERQKSTLKYIYERVVNATLFGFGATTSFWVGTSLVTFSLISFFSIMIALSFWIVGRITTMASSSFHSAASLIMGVAYGIDHLSSTFYSIAGTLFSIGATTFSLSLVSLIVLVTAAIGLNFWAHGKPGALFIQEEEVDIADEWPSPSLIDDSSSPSSSDEN
eukprot:TRINITY_DN5240_c0_g1_i1.p1 TRINITY_DN5240_c0_g1~~TRINITY_DN5240_c0_g1_i1.p1  ORF type:complete len:193 (+),score=60.92 TRINITY_DN5240_c0_g1_i1:258-836(+)